MPLTVTAADKDEFAVLVKEVARLRIQVFREWPYLYDGDLAYEERYLSDFAASPSAVLVVARDGAEIIGAATGTQLGDHDAAFAKPLVSAGFDPARVFYCAESVLLSQYRGQGVGHRFFDLREAAARAAGFDHAAFCAVLRDENHPARPSDYTPLDPFWRKRGYAPLSGAIVQFAWRDVGLDGETTKPMQVWIKRLV